LIEALATPDSSTREKAARILGSIGEPAATALPALAGLLKDKDVAVRLAVAKAHWIIGKNADVVVPVLADLLEEKWAGTFEAGEPRRRYLQAVIESIGRIGAPAKAAIPALTVKTKDPMRLISESAQNALKEIGAPAAPVKAVARS